ncbi:MAG: HD domain-containing protein [Anaerolineales bacterium]|nr:MAG: HD domain-containing protein [Anaerolineales bacterium]
MDTRQSDVADKFVSLLVSHSAYVILVFYGYPYLGNIAGTAAAIPVLAIAWYYGLGGGLVAALLSISTNMVLLLLAGASSLEAPLELIFNTFIILFYGASAGFISETRRELLKEIRLRENAEKALHYLNAQLEGRVKTRTRQLSSLNTQLSAELQARKRAQAGLQYRGSILETIAGIAEDTLKADNYVEPIPDMLRSLGQATRVERVRLFQNIPSRSPRDRSLSLRKEWVAHPRFKDRLGPRKITYREAGLLRWQRKLAAGEIVTDTLDGVDPDVRNMMNQEEIRSILIMPIFSGPQWWGSISLASITSKRKWGRAETSALRAVADILGAHIQRESEYERTLLGWAKALELRDQETEGHTQRVTRLAVELATRLGYNDAELTDIRRGALLHDIGKLGVPDAILNKPGKLSESEWRIMRKHPEYARDMLRPIIFLHSALPIPYAHHERWDGNGYPRKLKGARIPAPARLFAVVDVWDALTSDRPYRKAWSPSRAAQFMLKQMGTHFDPEILPIFLAQMVDLGVLPARALKAPRAVA